AGAVTRTQYDNDGHAISVTAYANVISSTNLNTLPLTMAWSDISARLSVNAANDRTTYNVYDAAGRLAYTVDALNYATVNVYDALGRITSTTRYAKPLASLPAMTVSGLSTAVAGIADTTKDQTESFVYYANGNVKSTTDALQKTESYTYDGLGNKLSFTNKKGDTWTYQYDNAGRLTQETSPLVAMTTVADASGNATVTGNG